MQETNSQLVRLGSTYGGYWVPQDLFTNPGSTGFISAGLGRDISLDLELLDRGLYGIGIDPIQDYISDAFTEVSGRKLQEKYILICAALTPRGEDMVLFQPEKGDSWRNTPDPQAGEFSTRKTFPGIHLSQVINSFGPEIENIIVKMDIEGVELDIINSFLALDTNVRYLIIEFDVLSQIPFKSVIKRIRNIIKSRKTLRHLKNDSFRLVKIEEFNFAFIRV